MRKTPYRARLPRLQKEPRIYNIARLLEALPRPVVRTMRDAWLGALDLRDRLQGRSDELTPPRALHFIGDGDFKAVGNDFLNRFKTLGALRPDERVLDIGCGTGRMAIPMLSHLDSRGSYTGFDISKKAIQWCSQHVTARNPRFVFHYANLYNKEYNSGGTIAAVAYRFPCADESIDFAFATSVFTHMREAEVRHYLAELHRVLRPNGRAMLNFFVLDDTARELMEQGKAALQFRFALPDCHTTDERTPERAIAYSAAQLHQMLVDEKLVLTRPILFGSWSGRPAEVEGQDVLIVAKS